MLLVQDICLSWHKEERDAVYARARTEFPMAYSMDKIPSAFQGDVFVHRLKFCQKGVKIEAMAMREQYRFQFQSSVQDLNLTNLSIQPDFGRYEVTFFYDQNRGGRPVRQGHNKDYHNVDSPLYCHDILNETAFFLEQGQYGRVLWNERNLDYDTGEWYYQLHVYNLFHSPDKGPETNTFLIQSPDFMYQQMAILF